MKPEEGLLLLMALTVWLYSRRLWSRYPQQLCDLWDEQMIQRLYAQERTANAHASLLVEQSGIPLLPRRLAHELGAYRRAKYRLRTVVALTVGLCLLLCWQLHTFPLVPVCMALPSLLVHRHALTLSKTRMLRTIALMQRHRPVLGVGGLAEALECGDEAITRQARAALTTILPTLRETDTALIGVGQLACLHRAMRGYHTPFLLATLFALEKIGTDKSVIHVRRLTECHAWIADYPAVRLAATRCLAQIEARVEQGTAKTTLLRMSAPGPSSAYTLLRPAHDVAATGAEQLLRASQPIECRAFAEADDQEALPILLSAGIPSRWRVT